MPSKIDYIEAQKQYNIFRTNQMNNVRHFIINQRANYYAFMSRRAVERYRRFIAKNR